MPLQSAILAGNPRLENANNGGPSVKKRLPDDEPSAVRAIQRALVSLGFPLPNSYPNGKDGEPDGIFGEETFKAVYGFQKREFPNAPGEWDGRVGPKTLQRMDSKLPPPKSESAFVQGTPVRTASNCMGKSPNSGPGIAMLRPGFGPPQLPGFRRT